MLFNTDRDEIDNFLSSVKNVRRDDYLDMLQKIAAKDFKYAKPSYNDLIILGLLLIVNIIFSPIGIILLILGIIKNINSNIVAKYKIKRVIMYNKDYSNYYCATDKKIFDKNSFILTFLL